MPASFKPLGDDTYSVSVGTPANCRGVTYIDVRIVACDEVSLKLSAAPVLDLLPEFRDAVFEGVRISWERLALSRGVAFELLSAYVKPSDESRTMYLLAGSVAIESWWNLVGSPLRRDS